MDREKVIKGLEMCLADEYCDGCPYEEDCFDPDIDNPWGSGVMRDALELLKSQPEIVRCKDCKNGEDDHDPYLDIVWCRVHERRFDADWFCADGVKKE